MNPLDELEEGFEETVRNMPDNIFDSHAFILRLVKPRTRQRSYVNALTATSGDDPFRKVHLQIAQRLAKRTELVKSLGKVSSKNIFGDPSPNENWERV